MANKTQDNATRTLPRAGKMISLALATAVVLGVQIAEPAAAQQFTASSAASPVVVVHAVARNTADIPESERSDKKADRFHQVQPTTSGAGQRPHDASQANASQTQLAVSTAALQSQAGEAPRTTADQASFRAAQATTHDSTPVIESLRGDQPEATHATGQANAVTPQEGTAMPFFDLDNPDKPDAAAAIDTESVEGNREHFMRLAIWFVVILCGFVLVILGIRKSQRGRGLLPTRSDRSRVIETLSLGPGRSISLIEMDGLRALVGADAGGIRTIVLAPPSFDEQIDSADLNAPAADRSQRATAA